MATPAPQLANHPDLSLIDDPVKAAIALHPIRRKLLERLTSPDSAAGLARKLDLPRQKVNYHLRELERAGMVEPTGETRQRRGCEERIVRAVSACYLIDPTALGLGAAPDPDDVRDHVSATYLIALAARAIRDIATLRKRAGAVGKNLPTFSMHADVRVASPGALNAFTEDLANCVAQCIARHHDESAADARSFRLLVGSYPTITKTESEARQEAATHHSSRDQS